MNEVQEFQLSNESSIVLLQFIGENVLSSQKSLDENDSNNAAAQIKLKEKSQRESVQTLIATNENESTIDLI